mmetsp:Transcript_93549/g.264576  ORF Transcript_93549/g.264576 Transcript_93549/m.264576 type:complete len:266 (-) Transcript_93549:296-1093(-)
MKSFGHFPLPESVSTSLSSLAPSKVHFSLGERKSLSPHTSCSTLYTGSPDVVTFALILVRAVSRSASQTLFVNVRSPSVRSQPRSKFSNSANVLQVSIRMMIPWKENMSNAVAGYVLSNTYDFCCSGGMKGLLPARTSFFLRKTMNPKSMNLRSKPPSLLSLTITFSGFRSRWRKWTFSKYRNPFAISLISRATFGAVSQSVRRSSSALPSTEPTLTNLSSSSSLPQSSRCNQIISSVWFSSKVNPVSGDTFGPDMLKHFMNLSL